MLLPLLLSLAALIAAAQPQAPVQVRPGESPEGVSAVPISETAEPVGLAIASFDSDDDGRTTRAELNQALLRSFAAADRDGDGLLGYIEYSAWATIWLGSATALPGPYAIDADGDDRISREELLAEFGRIFVRLDRDSDGAVSHGELLTVSQARMPPLPRERRQQPPVMQR
jgi:Ca2+-binding EF-hand superfamily protein